MLLLLMMMMLLLVFLLGAYDPHWCRVLCAVQRRFKVAMFEYRMARNIQRVYRGHVGRRWFRYLQHRVVVHDAASLINRVYRFATLVCRGCRSCSPRC